jgi:hypothetical protein
LFSQGVGSGWIRGEERRAEGGAISETKPDRREASELRQRGRALEGETGERRREERSEGNRESETDAERERDKARPGPIR